MSPEKGIPWVSFKGDPSLVHDSVGGGFPVALQNKVMGSLSSIVTFLGCVIISGWSIKKKKKIITKMNR